MALYCKVRLIYFPERVLNYLRKVPVVRPLISEPQGWKFCPHFSFSCQLKNKNSRGNKTFMFMQLNPDFGLKSQANYFWADILDE